RTLRKEEALQVRMIVKNHAEHFMDFTLKPVGGFINVCDCRRAVIFFGDQYLDDAAPRFFPMIEVIQDLKAFGEVDGGFAFEKILAYEKFLCDLADFVF